uniref:Uncharacterized protein n=1 Tax=Heliothis virescens TaxID=7102 RepID=A0A2A4JQ12_HELVI
MDKNGEAESQQRELLQAALAEKAEELKALQVLQKEGAGFFTPRQSPARTPPTTSISTPGLIIAANPWFHPCPAHNDAHEPGPDIEQGREENLDVTRRGPGGGAPPGHSTTKRRPTDLRPTTECVTFGGSDSERQARPTFIALATMGEDRRTEQMQKELLDAALQEFRCCTPPNLGSDPPGQLLNLSLPPKN